MDRDWTDGPLGPSKQLEGTLRLLYEAFGRTGWWLGFGGLWGLVMNGGVIPDGDLDICMLYPTDWKKVVSAMKSRGYVCSKVLLNDAEPENALYAGFNRKGFPHICISFWYPYCDVRYFCHDEKHTSSGVCVPKDGYWLKGVPGWAVENSEAFHLVDWPGLPGSVQVSVPIWPGVILDHCYPLWAFKKQRYVPTGYGDVRPESCASYHKGGAISPYRIHVRSMKELSDINKIKSQSEVNKIDYYSRLKNLRVRG
jgi:hypothetical protein